MKGRWSLGFLHMLCMCGRAKDRSVQALSWVLGEQEIWIPRQKYIHASLGQYFAFTCFAGQYLALHASIVQHIVAWPATPSCREKYSF